MPNRRPLISASVAVVTVAVAAFALMLWTSNWFARRFHELRTYEASCAASELAIAHVRQCGRLPMRWSDFEQGEIGEMLKTPYGFGTVHELRQYIDYDFGYDFAAPSVRDGGPIGLPDGSSSEATAEANERLRESVDALLRAREGVESAPKQRE